jgi:hypothetical protein
MLLPHFHYLGIKKLGLCDFIMVPDIKDIEQA